MYSVILVINEESHVKEALVDKEVIVDGGAFLRKRARRSPEEVRVLGAGVE